MICVELAYDVKNNDRNQHSQIYLISCSDDKSVIIWDVQSLTLLKGLNFEDLIVNVISYDYYPKSVTCTKHISNNIEPKKVIIASSVSGKLFIFELEKIIRESCKMQKEEYENENLVSKIYFDKRIIEKYNLKKNKLQLSSQVAHNFYGILVCGFNEGIMCVWDLDKILKGCLEQKKFLHEFENFVIFLECVHDSLIHLAEFNKRGDYFISGSVDGLVLVWKVQENILNQFRLGLPTEPYYPIYSVYRITEGENKVKCNVNAVTWSSGNNYVAALISSRNRKKNNVSVDKELKTNREVNNSSSAFNPNNVEGNANQGMVVESQINPNVSVTQINNESPGVHNCKRSSAILIFQLDCNRLIRRFDEENGFSLHDECYILESHPRKEEILLTVTSLNEIVLLDFIKGVTLKKFKEENFFFTNISQQMTTLEGKFSPKGDSFVVSTYLGSISIYNIYSRASFSGSYMNQFFSDEFIKNDTEEENRINNNFNSQDPYNNTFKTFVNMWNLPYIVSQPYSKFKLNTLENFLFEKIEKKYNLTLKEIHHKLMNNYQIYEKNLEERVCESAKEEKIFKLSTGENLNYTVRDNMVENIEESDNMESEYVDDYSQNELEEIESASNSQSPPNETYNLRSRNAREERGNRSERRNRFNLRRLRSQNNNQRSTSRRRLRSRRRVRARNTSNEINIRDEISSLNDVEMNSLRSKNEFSENFSDFSEEAKHTKKNNKHSINADNEEIEDDMNMKWGKKISLAIKNCKLVEESCFLCGNHSEGMIGPFTSENQIEYILQENLNLSLNNFVDSSQALFFFHIDCVLNFNDFIQYHSERRRGGANKWTPDLTSTIKETIEQKKICSRCDSLSATKKCKSCDKYFHGFLCLTKYCVEIEDGIVLCLECFKTEKINPNITEIETPLSIKEFSDINRSSLLKTMFSYYTYNPQLNDRVYFILQAYEDFLRKYYENIVFEVDKIFFWLNNNYDCYTPFPCEVSKIEYCFPNKQTVNILKKTYKSKNDWTTKLKIITKINLLTPFGNIDIVYFENDCPDFLILSDNYEKNKEIYLSNKKKWETICSEDKDEALGNSLLDIPIVIGDTSYLTRFIKLSAREINQKYEKSYFENILVEYKTTELLEREKIRVSFWDLENHDLKRSKEDFLKNICENLKKKIDEILIKGYNKYYIFLEMVNEKKDKAEDYYTLIVAPMYISLIKERLKNVYYNSIDSIRADINLLQLNACTFNSENSKISQYSKQLVQEIKNALIIGNTVSYELGDKNKRITKSLDLPIQIYENNCRSLRSRNKEVIGTIDNHYLKLEGKSQVNIEKSFDFELNLKDDLYDSGEKRIFSNKIYSSHMVDELSSMEEEELSYTHRKRTRGIKEELKTTPVIFTRSGRESKKIFNK